MSSTGCARNGPLRPPDTNSDTKPMAIQHRRMEANLPLPHRAQPVKCLDSRGHADAHGQDRKGECRVGAHAAHEHVMAPDHEAEEADGQHRVHHGAVAEDRLARERRQHLRSHAHPGQDRDVNLGMPEEPEQVLPEQRRAALVRHESGRSPRPAARRSWFRGCDRAAAGFPPRAARRTRATRESR